MTIKRPAVLLTAVLLAAALAGCGTNNGGPSAGTGGPTASVSALPATASPASTVTPSPGASPSSDASPAASGASPASNGAVKTFTAKVTAKSGSVLTIDVPNDSFQTNGSPSPAGTGVTTNLPLTVPDSAVITLASGKTGTIGDIKVGDTLSVTMNGSDVSAVTVNS
ncbi:hypothetical protein SAMN02745823_02993 [Sporobacter termitidis DSM 10068]|uniref:DUF5666 domain-containing protein n=1 Tax=Sporobacter termitidis DSM 10068 TaxID=1123282 RepID=A0A1M5YYK9_9FIRM|nr:hypothetical protein [Sporobacter termitidis]SHI16954.1 hypothetical protein SAMN02745823_02993 [Sporobacter termitidis DSM 10068]